jgi:hypothetical protein
MVERIHRKEKLTKQPSNELKNLVIQNYKRMASADGAANVYREIYSTQEGVTVIGTDPKE